MEHDVIKKKMQCQVCKAEMNLVVNDSKHTVRISMSGCVEGKLMESVINV